jgi:hypothetical protein
MTAEELQEGHIQSYKSIVSLKTSIGRAIRTLFTTKNFFSTLSSFYWNYECYNMFNLKRLKVSPRGYNMKKA